MQCNNCGQHSDWVGNGSEWKAVTNASTTLGLYECDVCGNRQRVR